MYQFDVFAMWDTRSNPALTYLFEPAYHPFPKEESVNTNGHGACVFVSARLVKHCQFLGYHPHIPLAWLKVSDVYVGFVYAKPSMLGSLDQNTSFLAMLHVDVSMYQAKGKVLLLGDFNARIGDLPDACTTPREHDTSDPNEFGKLLMQYITQADMITTTGRLDAAEYTYVGHNSESRIDHAFLDSSLFPLVERWRVHETRYGSDHHPISLSLLVTFDNIVYRDLPARLQWDHRQSESYIQHILQDVGMLQQIDAALDHVDIERADELLRQLIWSAAQSCGMVIASGACKRKPRHKLVLSAEAHVVRRKVAAFLKNNMPVPIEIRHAWRAHLKVAQKSHADQQHVRMKDWLCSRPRLFWKRYKHQCNATSCILPMARLFCGQVWPTA